MGNVMVIPAKRQIGNTGRKQDAKPKLRVAAYCRVSTDSDEQATSYEAQVEHYTEYIKKNPEWEFAGIYADDGISGKEPIHVALTSLSTDSFTMFERIKSSPFNVKKAKMAVKTKPITTGLIHFFFFF